MLDWQHAGFKCIRQRPRSSIAKTKGAGGIPECRVRLPRVSVPAATRGEHTARDEFFCGYTPAASPTAMKSMRATIKSLNIPRQTPGTLAEIAQQLNPLLRGWIAYYGRYSRSALSTLADYVNRKLRAWIMRKFKRFQSHKTRASLFVRKLARENPGLFVHWKAFGTNTFA
ncbi:group II intron maturase-specific domain-containing protein [Mesorhizobium sp. M1328]|uniref:group II intron maturase-specific domain-containing protein n=1 Tax=Mesorhizobium sp. M1328 TaxID=2957082 RepID=UPI003335184B